jgi:hydroxybutyrate-dimer hydrolase
MKTTTLAGMAALAMALAGCAGTAVRPSESSMFTAQRVSEYRDGDDLLTAGMGIAGLRSMAAPAFADAGHPTAAEARRRAIWSNWRGIADLMPAGGYGELYGSTVAVPGREFSAFARVPGAHQPHRVLVQVPDGFDHAKRCVLVAPSSGSRGVYGAIAVAGAWGLPKGCAVAYTDKGTGTDYFDLDAQAGVRADGTVGAVGASDDLAFVPDADVGAAGIAIKHAHSKDNPEADWGRHVRQAAEFALQALGEAFPADAPFRFDNTRVIAVGISNGGGAVLRAAELDGDWLDAVVAGEPEVHVDGRGGRALYDYATQAALLMPCALLDVEGLAQSPLSAMARAQGALRCASLAANGTLQGADTAAQARHAHALLRGGGWSDAALHAGALSVDFDLWRAVAVTYASAYGRHGVGEHPCGFAFSAQDKTLGPRAATAAERAAWWSDAAGIPPGAGVGIIDARLAPPDFTLPGLQCLRALWDGSGADAHRVRSGIDESRARLPRAGLPMIVIHGTDDGLVPQAFSSAPYVAMAKAAGRDVRYWQVRNVQHFDAFLALPDYGARYLPLLPYVYAALDRVSAHLDDPLSPLPADAVIATQPRGAAPMMADHLAIPR